jgi:hypothetical protein
MATLQEQLDKLTELRLGPVRSERDVHIALSELEQKINEIIRVLKEVT